jgi:hypothetical protein
VTTAEKKQKCQDHQDTGKYTATKNAKKNHQQREKKKMIEKIELAILTTEHIGYHKELLTMYWDPEKPGRQKYNSKDLNEQIIDEVGYAIIDSGITIPEPCNMIGAYRYGRAVLAPQKNIVIEGVAGDRIDYQSKDLFLTIKSVPDKGIERILKKIIK